MMSSMVTLSVTFDMGHCSQCINVMTFNCVRWMRYKLGIASTLKSSFLSLGKPRGDLLMQEEESPEVEKRYPVSIEDQALVGLPLV